MSREGVINSKEELIVLHTVKFGDSGIVVQVLTESSGREGLLLRGAGKSKKTHVLAHLHPLSILEAEISHSRKGSLGYLKTFHPKHQLQSFRSNVIKANIVLFMCELVNKTVRESQGDARLYNYIRESVILLDSIEDNYSNYHLIFIVKLASLLGFHPENNYSPINCLFDIEKAMFVPLGYQSGNSLEREESETIHLLLESDLEEALNLKFSGDKRFRFINSFIKYLEYHLDYKLNIKSHLVLHELIHN